MSGGVGLFFVAVAATGCTVTPSLTKEYGLNFFPAGCSRAVKRTLRDPASYIVVASPKIVQKTKFTTWEWSYNAKNGYGGYGDSSTVLCYVNEKGAAEIFTRSADESDLLSGRNSFLAKTDPELNKKIESERQTRHVEALRDLKVALEQAQETEKNYKLEIANICNGFKGADPVDMPEGCPEYFKSGYIPYPPE